MYPFKLYNSIVLKCIQSCETLSLLAVTSSSPGNSHISFLALWVHSSCSYTSIAAPCAQLSALHTSHMHTHVIVCVLRACASIFLYGAPFT